MVCRALPKRRKQLLVMSDIDQTVVLWLWFKFLKPPSYFRVLSIPIHECRRFSLKPLKWLRYLGYAIYGKPGCLKAGPSSDNLQEVDYDREIESRSYYFYSDGALIDTAIQYMSPSITGRRASVCRCTRGG